MTEAEKIAAGLTEAQRRAILAMSRHPACSYRLRLSLATLNGLRRRKLVNSRGGPGSTWSPQTSVDWWLNESGLEVRAILTSNQGDDRG